MVWVSTRRSRSKWRMDHFPLFWCIQRENISKIFKEKRYDHKLKNVFLKVFQDWDRISLRVWVTLRMYNLFFLFPFCMSFFLCTLALAIYSLCTVVPSFLLGAFNLLSCLPIKKMYVRILPYNQVFFWLVHFKLSTCI